MTESVHTKPSYPEIPVGSEHCIASNRVLSMCGWVDIALYTCKLYTFKWKVGNSLTFVLFY